MKQLEIFHVDFIFKLDIILIQVTPQRLMNLNFRLFNIYFFSIVCLRASASKK